MVLVLKLMNGTDLFKIQVLFLTYQEFLKKVEKHFYSY